LQDGTALEKFRELIAAQGGDARVVDEPGRLPQAKFKVPLVATKGGYVTEVDAMGAALAALQLGAGRAKAEDAVDHAVGIGELVKIGERVEAGTALAVIYANDGKALTEAREMLAKAITVGATAPAEPRLIDEIVG
jgi:thymidine phosphorylase